jgi:carbonic anhydrase/acetyltransferase-like protein (isoleucine patch superfamily)
LPTHPHHGASPEVHPTAWLAPNATLIGDVHIGEGASVWFGAVLRGDVCTISIGAYTNVQDNTVIHVEASHDERPCNPCTVGSRVTIGHACIVHGSTIEDRVLVGMGAVVMNRSHIGTDCILGARALVSEDKDIAPRSLVIGIPGKVARPVSEQEVSFIPYSAQHYWELAQSYKTGQRD